MVKREIRVYRLGKDDEVTYLGRATVEVVPQQLLEPVGASSRLEPTPVDCVGWGGKLYRLEEEAGRPAVFICRKDQAPPTLR